MASNTLIPTGDAPENADERPAPPTSATPSATPSAVLPVAQQTDARPSFMANAGAAPANGRASTDRAPASAFSVVRVESPVAAPRMKPKTLAQRLRRGLALLLGSVLLVVTCAALLAPPLLALVGGVWAVVTEVRAIAAIWTLARRQDFGGAVAHLATLDAASRIAFLGVSFFALLFALMLLMAGLLGRRWARLFVAPGLVFTAPTLVCYVVGWLWLAPVAARYGVSSLAQTSLAAYALLDAVVLAAALCDMRPTLRRARRVARLGKRTLPSLPAVRISATPVSRPLASAVDTDESAYNGGSPGVYPPPAFALAAPVTRPLAAVRIEDVAATATGASDADERDEFAVSAEAETWRIFSGEWAAWAADDMALRQEVTLPALGWPLDDETAESDVVPTSDEITSAISVTEHGGEVDEAEIAETAEVAEVAAAPQDEPIADVAAPVSGEMTTAPEPLHGEAAQELVPETTAPPDETPVASLPVHAPITETAALATLTTISEAVERADVQAAPDTPLDLAPA